MDLNEVERFEKLLKSFKSISLSEEEEPETFSDICGFPHYENVVSNILAFFFDESKPHGLNGLFVKSLFESCGILDKIEDFQFSVEREVRTDSGKFIDIVLKNDSSIVLIENKIFAGLYNDLDDYYAYGEKQNSIEVHGIVLSMYEINLDKDRFINITYSNFFKFIRNKIGYFLGNSNNRYLVFLIDLMNNIEKLYKGGVGLNKEFTEFILKNEESVEKFGTELKRFHDDLRKKIKEVNSIVVEALDVEKLDVKQWQWRELPSLWDTAVSDFKLENGVDVAIDSDINVHGWRFSIFVRRNPEFEFSLLDFCRSKGLDGELIDERFVLKEELEIDVEPTVVSSKIVKLIRTLKN